MRRRPLQRLVATSLGVFLMIGRLAQSREGGVPQVPDPLSMVHPGSRGVSPAEVELGKILFFDRRLSSNDSMTCVSCHSPQLGFGDGERLSKGVSGNRTRRHAPSLFNLAWSKTFFWDGRATSLEEQLLGPLSNPDELNMPMDALVVKLKGVPFYVQAFERVYPGSGLTRKNIARAIAAFERTLVAGGSPLDRYVRGDEGALSPSAVRGMKLFFGRAVCSTCHSGANFTDGKFHNTGVPGEDAGRSELDRVGEFQTRPYPFFQTQRAFKTPGLRNVALSAPYMHNGSEATLRDVVSFYNQGGKAKQSYGLSLDIHPLGLSAQEMADLVAFLESLTSPLDVRPPAIPGPSDLPADDLFGRAEH